MQTLPDNPLPPYFPTTRPSITITIYQPFFNQPFPGLRPPPPPFRSRARTQRARPSSLPIISPTSRGTIPSGALEGDLILKVPIPIRHL